MDTMHASEGNDSSGEVETAPISVVQVSLQNQVQQAYKIISHYTFTQCSGGQFGQIYNINLYH